MAGANLRLLKYQEPRAYFDLPCAVKGYAWAFLCGLNTQYEVG